MNLTEMMDLDYNALMSSMLGDAIDSALDIESNLEIVGATVLDLYNNNMDLLNYLFTFDIGSLIL